MNQLGNLDEETGNEILDVIEPTSSGWVDRCIGYAQYGNCLARWIASCTFGTVTIEHRRHNGIDVH